ncbi:multidrug resistance protein 2 [Fictibacillus macauensis ZFHKF-1]|uniref:Multidrug resistance protein 2 n=1 Tax=Fictibacillus macauensis ZFHKF-1 TaxID=1196324 RepID=I8AFQ8_9BACL|nr:MFS transporter [Fictibacillus macauensis]EIT84214.1 multidrug resistance protein 2 [Fictibacillus macauensis ZFHKF-1]
MNQSKGVFAILLINIFIAFLGMALIFPVMPAFINSMHLSGSTLGYLVATFAFAQLIVSPFSGRWVDQYGRKRFIVIGLLLFGVSQVIFAVAHVVPLLYVSRVIGGVSAAFVTPGVTAYVADITTDRERAKAMGFVSAAISTGYIIGPGVGGFLATYGVRAPFFTAAIFGLIACLLSLFVLKETLTEEAKVTNRANAHQSSFFSDLKRSLLPVYFIAFLIVFILALGLSSYESIFSLFTNRRFGYSPQKIALIVTISSIVGMLVQVIWFGKLVQSLGEKKLIQLCLLGGAILAVVSTIISGFIAVLLVTTFIFLAFDLLRPALTTFLSKTAQNEQGFVAGMNSAYTSLGNIIGPTMGGLLFDWSLLYPYLFSAAALLLGLLFTNFWKEE